MGEPGRTPGFFHGLRDFFCSIRRQRLFANESVLHLAALPRAGGLLLKLLLLRRHPCGVAARQHEGDQGAGIPKLPLIHCARDCMHSARSADLRLDNAFAGPKINGAAKHPPAGAPHTDQEVARAVDLVSASTTSAHPEPGMERARYLTRAFGGESGGPSRMGVWGRPRPHRRAKRTGPRPAWHNGNSEHLFRHLRAAAAC
jgi:hypothetical protein